jgi:hypothetical protein
MSKFISLLPGKKNEVDEEIYEILMSLVDFGIFRELIGDYKTAH